MRSKKRITGKRSSFRLIGILLSLIFLFLFSISISGFAQEVQGEKKEVPENFSYLIENGAKMIREYEFANVLNRIETLPPEKRADFRIRVLENFAALKGYLVVEKRELGKKWQSDYKAMLFTMNKTATAILVDLLKDKDPYMRAFTARALGYLGDESVLVELERIATQDQNSKVRSRAREAYHKISGKKLP